MSDYSEDTVIFNTEALKVPQKKRVIPTLIIIRGADTGKVLPLVQSASYLGRDEIVDITINDPSVSRRHLLIEVDEKHVCCIDLKSTNGTFVNDQKISKLNLKEGDKIRLGNTVIKFSYQDREDKRYQDKVYQMITFDELTSLYNRRNMYSYIDLCLEKAKKREPLSLLFIDIDYFKRVNDKYGHLSGSKLLSDLGMLFLTHIRSNDIACRYGGEEFVIIIPGTNRERSYLAAEKLRKIVERHNFYTIHNELIKITISIGIATYDPSISSAKQFIEIADMAMYRAKEKGRNRIE